MTFREDIRILKAARRDSLTFLDEEVARQRADKRIANRLFRDTKALQSEVENMGMGEVAKLEDGTSTFTQITAENFQEKIEERKAPSEVERLDDLPPEIT